MSRKFENLKITFYMRTPIALGHPWIHFDGLIAHLLRRQLLRDEYYVQPSKLPIGLDNILERDKIDPMPLERHVAGNTFVYKASISFLEPRQIYLTTIYKRFHERWSHEIRTKKRYIDTSRGRFRGFMMKLPYIPAKRVIFYCRGEKDRIEELLKGLAGLGKKVAIGFGTFREFKIEVIEEDRSLVWNGRAMRPIPISMLRYWSDAFNSTYKPPYWDKRNVRLCAPPGALVKLLEDRRKRNVPVVV